MDQDDYTLMSSHEVSELKQDVEYLKKNPLGGLKSGKSLQESLDRLNDNIEQLIEIFKEASDTVKAEERESDVIMRRIEPMERKLDELSEQNQKIAKGILAVADMVSSKEEELSRPAQMPRPMPMMPRPMQPPKLPPMGGMPPPPSQPLPQMGMPLPPLPKTERKGLLGFIKK